jgi:hypothetical protein
MEKSYFTKEDIDKNMLVSDFLIGKQSVFFGQEGNTRQFLVYPPGKDDYIVVFANMDRNDWYCTNPVMGGKVTDLAEKVFSMPLNADTLNTIYKISSLIDSLTKPSTYLIDPTDKIQVSVDVTPLDHNYSLIPLYCMGISQSVAYKFLKDGTYTGIRDGKEHHTPLFPNSNGGYYSLGPNGWRTLGKEGITLLGPTRDLQRLCVFENPLDFLALQQKRHKLGTEVFFDSDRYLIINGKSNLDDALGHVANHPEYYHVCCFFPITDSGIELSAKFDDICRGTYRDSSRLYVGHTSLADSLDYETRAARNEGVSIMTAKMNAAIERVKRAKEAKEHEAEIEAAKKQQTETRAAERQQPKVRDVPQTPTVRDTPKPKSETTQTTQKVATDDDNPKRGFRR